MRRAVRLSALAFIAVSTRLATAVDRGFGAATDSDGDIYKVIF
ncbi:MAG: hypothetical protein AB7I36_18235 [Rhodospirillaceae bacterium]